MTGVVIIHPEWGIFVGVSLGLAFWSAIDCVGQETVPVMESETDARAFIDSWVGASVKSGDFTYHPVPTKSTHATIEELDAAGLSAWTIPLKAARMGEAQGSA